MLSSLRTHARHSNASEINSMLSIIRNNCRKEAFEHCAGMIATDAGYICYVHVQKPCLSVAAMRSIKMAEPVGRAHPKPGAGTSLSCSDSSDSNPAMPLEVLRAPIRERITGT